MTMSTRDHHDAALATVPTLRARWRAQTLTPLRGAVLDVGAGTGNSLPYLTNATTVACVEPHRGSLRTLRQLTVNRDGTQVLRGRAEQIPLDDRSADVAICCGVLCSVSDQDQALTEIGRVLRPGGRIVFLEHVAAPRGTWVRRGQSVVAPFSRWLDHGCDPARDTAAALTRSGLTLVDLSETRARGPFGTSIPHLAGVAVRPSLNR
ncbi:MAG: class I SAM-dependent methyltransferase [Nocardioidaceae bacterium]